MTTSCEPALGTLPCALRIDHRREEEQSYDQTADCCGVVDDDWRGGDTLRGLRGGERSEGARRAGARAAAGAGAARARYERERARRRPAVGEVRDRKREAWPAW